MRCAKGYNGRRRGDAHQRRTRRPLRLAMTTRRDGPAVEGADVPITLLLGGRWSAAARSARHLPTRLPRQLRHDVEVCDVEHPEEPARLLRELVGRGATRLVLLPVTLGELGLSDPRRADGLRAARDAYPFLRVHRGRPPATDDIARMLGDRARRGATSHPSEPSPRGAGGDRGPR